MGAIPSGPYKGTTVFHVLAGESLKGTPEAKRFAQEMFNLNGHEQWTSPEWGAVPPTPPTPAVPPGLGRAPNPIYSEAPPAAPQAAAAAPVEGGAQTAAPAQISDAPFAMPVAGQAESAPASAGNPFSSSLSERRASWGNRISF